MPHDRVRTHHDELAQMAALFGQEADAVAKTIGDLRQRKDTLQGGDWVGEAARRFYAEMDGQVLPTLLRLQRALTRSQSVVRALSRRMRQCEDDAARQLQDREAFTGQPVGGSGGSLPATGGEFVGQPVGGSGGSLPATGEIGVPAGETSGGSLPEAGGRYSVGGSAEFGPYSISGSVDVLSGGVSDTGRFGTTADGQLAGSDVDLTFDPFGSDLSQVSVTGEGVLLGGQAAFGWGDALKGVALTGTGGAYSAEASLLGGWVRPSAAFELLSGNVFVGQQEGNYGTGGSLNSGSAELGLVIGGPNLGLTFGAGVGGPSADLQAGLMGGSGAAGGGGRLASLTGDVGLNVLGWNIGLGGGVEAGGSFGFQLGEHTEVKLGPLAGSLLIGNAK